MRQSINYATRQLDGRGDPLCLINQMHTITTMNTACGSNDQKLRQSIRTILSFNQEANTINQWNNRAMLSINENNKHYNQLMRTTDNTID